MADVSSGWPGTTLVTYVYDVNGNRLTKTLGAGPPPTSAVYDAQDRLLSDSTATYTYNANGQLATKTVGSDVTTYTYDNLGSLLRVQKTGSGAYDVTYTVDGAGRRILKKLGGVSKKAWIYDGNRIIAEWDLPTGTVSKFVYVTKRNVPDVMIKTTTGGVTTTYRIISDHLGSVRMVVNLTTGAVDQQINYDDDGFGGVLSSSTGAGDFQPFGFAGGLYDYQTGLVRFGARDYDSEIGRWTAKDMARFSGGMNFLSYCDADPVNYRDPTGFRPMGPSSPSQWWQNVFDVFNQGPDEPEGPGSDPDGPAMRVDVRTWVLPILVNIFLGPDTLPADPGPDPAPDEGGTCGGPASGPNSPYRTPDSNPVRPAERWKRRKDSELDDRCRHVHYGCLDRATFYPTEEEKAAAYDVCMQQQGC